MTGRNRATRLAPWLGMVCYALAAIEEALTDLPRWMLVTLLGLAVVWCWAWGVMHQACLAANMRARRR